LVNIPVWNLRLCVLSGCNSCEYISAGYSNAGVLKCVISVEIILIPGGGHLGGNNDPAIG